MAANFRMIYDNAATRATITASSQASASLSSSNLTTDVKSQVWRSATAAPGVAPTAWLKLDFTSLTSIAAAALAATNLTVSSTMRLRGTSEAAATNLVTYSEGTASQLSASAGCTDDTAIGNFAASIRLTNTSVSAFAYKSGSVAAGTTYSISVFVRMDDGSAPVPATSSGNAAGDFMLVFAGAAYTATVSAVGGNLYRASVTIVAGATATGNFGVVKYTGNSTKGLRIQGFQLETGTVTSYYPTAAAAATRPVGFMDAWQSYTFDSGIIAGVPDAGNALLGWSGVNSFAYGGALSARVWMPSATPVRAGRIDITDPGNLGGYIEVSRLFCGSYWEGVRNVDYGAALSIVDSSKNSRNDAGDLFSDLGSRYRKITFNLSNLAPAERTTLWNVLWNNGVTKPLFISIFPNSTDQALEQSYQFAGKLTTSPPVGAPSFLQYTASLEIEEV